jgi:hypothetical protein
MIGIVPTGVNRTHARAHIEVTIRPETETGQDLADVTLIGKEA